MENNYFKANFLDHQIINGVVFYTISMVDPQNIKTYFLTSRYSSMLTLHQSLKQKYQESMNVLRFPPKKWFGNLKPSFISQRKKQLEEYLNSFLMNASLVTDPLTLQYFEMTENEKIFRKSVSPAKNHVPLRISVSRKYNVKGFFEEYEAHNQGQGHNGDGRHASSFSSSVFCPNKALEDLNKLKNGNMHVQAFLAAYDLLLKERNLDWEIINVVESKYTTFKESKTCTYHVMDKKKKKIYTVKLVQFVLQNDHTIYHSIIELFYLMYISKQISHQNLLLVKNCLYFEKEDRLCRELKKNLLIIREHCPFTLKEAIEIRKKKNMHWSVEELWNIYSKFISLFLELEKTGISHNSLNLNNIFYSKADNCYKVGGFVNSHHQKFLSDFNEEFHHFQTNSKYNSHEINELLNKEQEFSKNELLKLDLLKNDVFGLGIIFFEMFILNTEDGQDVLLDKIKMMSANNNDVSASEEKTLEKQILEMINSMLIENVASRFSFRRLWDVFFSKKDVLQNEKNKMSSDILLFNDLDIMLKEIHPENSQFKTKIKRLNMIAHAYNRISNHKAALEIYEDIFEQIKKGKVSAEEKKIKEIKIIRKMSLVYYDMADYKKADQLLKLALENCEKTENQTNLYSSILINLSKNCTLDYDFKSAYDYLEKAVELYINLFGENSSEVADLYNDQGLICEKMGDHEKALKLLEKALSIKSEKSSKPSIAIGKILINLGLVYQGMEQYDKALNCFNEALTNFQSIYGKICHDIIRIKNMIGGVYLLKKEYVDSLKFLEEAWAFSKELWGEKSLALTDVFFNLGKCYLNTKNFEKAKAFLKDAKKLRKHILGQHHIEVAEIRNILGCLYLEMNAYEKARKNLHVTLKIFKKVLGKTHLHIAELYNNYGYIHTKLNNLKKARKCHERCLYIYKIHLNSEHRYISITLNNLGSICLETGEYEEALIHFHEAVEILRKNDLHDLNLANIYNLMGIAYCQMSQYKDALEVLEASHVIYSIKLEKNNPKLVKLEKDIQKLKENIS